MGGKKPADVPAYFIAEAAHYLCVPRTTVRDWVFGREYMVGGVQRKTKPLITPADGPRELLSFLNLIELHVISSIRRYHGVRLLQIRRSIDYLSRAFKSKHPLLDKEMLTDGKSIFIEKYGQLINTSEDGQIQMKIMMEAYLQRIVWDESGIPIRLFPFTRDNIKESPRLVAIDPKVRFGKPCISGTGIPTGIIAERHKAGDAMSLLASDYGRTFEEIEEAVRYESRAAS